MSFPRALSPKRRSTSSSVRPFGLTSVCRAHATRCTGTHKEDEVKKPNEQDATEARTAGVPTRISPAAPYGAGATAERRAACTLLEVREATSPLRLPRVPLAPLPLPLPLPALPALPAPLLPAATPASVAAAAPEPDAFATPKPQAPQCRDAVADSAPRAAPGADALEKARAARERVAEVLKSDKLRLDAAKALINAKPTFAQAVEAKVSCEEIGARCSLISTVLEAASSSLLSAVPSMSADVQLAALAEVSQLVKNTTLAGAMHATAVAAVEAAASVALASAFDDELISGTAQPWFDSTMLNIDAAGDVLDAMIEKFKQLEEAAREQAKQPPAKRHRQSGPVIAAQRKTISRLVSIIEEKITGARRMLHLKPVASSAGGPTFWRGRDDHDEDLLEAILPKADVESNTTFTTVVNDSVAAHVAKYLPNVKPDEKMTVALMWTCPFELILRQLAHIDAVYGQAISVLMLSRSGDAFVVQSGAPRFSGDQVLSAMGLRPDHVTWLKQHMQWLHTKAEEFGVLFQPELCEAFMADVVDPGAPKLSRGAPCIVTDLPLRSGVRHEWLAKGGCAGGGVQAAGGACCRTGAACSGGEHRGGEARRVEAAARAAERSSPVGAGSPRAPVVCAARPDPRWWRQLFRAPPHALHRDAHPRARLRAVRGRCADALLPVPVRLLPI
jgi:hypothetical protein